MSDLRERLQELFIQGVSTGYADMDGYSEGQEMIDTLAREIETIERVAKAAVRWRLGSGPNHIGDLVEAAQAYEALIEGVPPRADA